MIIKHLNSILYSPVKGQWKQDSVTKPPLPPKSGSSGDYLDFYFCLIFFNRG